jgi:hypothetical protein
MAKLLSRYLRWGLAIDISSVFKHKRIAAVAATRGDLGQLAPRKKLLKSEKSSQKVSETLQALWQGGFFTYPSLLP